MKHINITISGKVQGVFFRASTKEKADLLGITGSVHNQTDGSVHVSAEGNEPTLDQFITWLHEGPPMAQVESVSVEQGDIENFQEFVID